MLTLSRCASLMRSSPPTSAVNETLRRAECRIPSGPVFHRADEFAVIVHILARLLIAHELLARLAGFRLDGGRRHCDRRALPLFASNEAVLHFGKVEIGKAHRDYIVAVLQKAGQGMLSPGIH